MSETVSELLDTQYLRERTAGITKELREKLSPTLGGMAFNVLMHGSEFFKNRERYRDFFTGHYVPYRFAAIPPDFFGNQQPRTFDDEAAFDDHLTYYWSQDDVHAIAEVKSGSDLTPLWSEKARRIVGRDLKERLLRPSNPIDFSGWDEYSRADMQLDCKTFMLNSFFTANGRPQERPTGFFDYFKDETEAGLIINSILLAGRGSVSAIYRSPILQGDVTLTNRLLNATLHATIIAANDEIALATFDELLCSAHNRDFFHKHVQRASTHGGTPDRNYGPDRLAHMATESFVTVSNAFALMAQELPDGYPYDGYQLISDLAEQNMVDKLTRLVPFGFIGPATLFGRYIPGLLYATEDHNREYKLHFNRDAIKALRAFSDNVQAHYAEQWREYDKAVSNNPSLPPPVQTGRRCPFSGKVKNSEDLSRPIGSVVAGYAGALALMFKVLNYD